MRRVWLYVGIILFVAFVWKLFILANIVPFNSDEAMVALMARHILQGERPFFFLWPGIYGQF